MTLLSIFRRRVLAHEELVFCSDSRLSGGQALDYAQKIFQLPRSDALFAFAGDTTYAYPLLLQMMRAVEHFPNSVDRRVPLAKMKGRTLRVFQQTYDAIHSFPVGQRYPDAPDNFFLLGGYDWLTSSFTAWRLAFDPQSRRFTYRRVVGDTGNRFFFSGDDVGAVTLAIARTRRLLDARGKTSEQIDMEPFEVLADIIRDPDFPFIGGAPQLGKVYSSSNTQLFQVLWSRREADAPHVTGRPLLPGERSVLPTYDPERGFYSPRGGAEGLRPQY